MLQKFLEIALYISLVFVKPVYADSFESTLDGVNNQYFQAVAFSASGYPSIENIVYTRNDFMAENTESILNSWNMEIFSDFDYTRRIPMVADNIYAPPGTTIDILYIYKNSTGHDVNISRIDLALSRSNPENGNLIDLLDVPNYLEKSFTYKYSNLNLTRNGLYKEYVGKGVIPNGENGKYILESVKVKNPLSIDETKAIANSEGGVDFEIYVQNNAKEYLNDLKFTYGDYEENFNLPANQEYVIKFSIQDIPSDLGTYKIYNPNIKQICAVYGSPYYTYTRPDSISVFAYRDNNIVPGAMVQPEREGFCIKRIPYTMISEPVVLQQTEVEEDKEDVVIEPLDVDMEVSSEEEVLGIADIDNGKILPRTGKRSYLGIGLLVVDVLLWYSVYILRRNYESKNTNSRIRTKSK